MSDGEHPPLPPPRDTGTTRRCDRLMGVGQHEARSYHLR